MKPNFKFSMDETVRVKSSGKLGTVIGVKHEYKFFKGKETIEYKYLIDGNKYERDWYSEECLEFEYQFDNKFEAGLNDLLIDVNLNERNFDMVKHFSNFKKN